MYLYFSLSPPIGILNKMKLQTSIALTFIQCIQIIYTESCYATNPDPYRRVGQKTSYFVNNNLDDSEVEVAGCEPRMLWYLSRHGARKPSDSEIEEFGEKMPGLQDRASNEDSRGFHNHREVPYQGLLLGESTY